MTITRKGYEMIEIKNEKRKGFTLIELIIVLAVLAIIAAIAIPNFMAVRDNSKFKADVQSCKTIKRTVLMLVSDGTVSTPSSDRIYTVTANGVVTIAASDSSDTAEVQKALKDVSAPQGVQATYNVSKGDYDKETSTASNYYIKLTSNGDVTVQTAAFTSTK